MLKFDSLTIIFMQNYPLLSPMNKEEIQSVIDYLTHLEEVLHQLGSYGDDPLTPYNLTHCEKSHLSRYTLQGLSHMKHRLTSIKKALPNEDF